MEKDSRYRFTNPFNESERKQASNYYLFKEIMCKAAYSINKNITKNIILSRSLNKDIDQLFFKENHKPDNPNDWNIIRKPALNDDQQADIFFGITGETNDDLGFNETSYDDEMKFILDSLNFLKISENTLGIFVCSENLITCSEFKISKYGKMKDNKERKNIFPYKDNFLDSLERKGFGVDAVLPIKNDHFWLSESLYKDHVVIIVKKIKDTLFYSSGLSFIAPLDYDGIKDYFLIEDRFRVGNFFLDKDFRIRKPSIKFCSILDIIIDYCSSDFEKYFRESFPEKKCPSEYESQTDYDENWIYEIHNDGLNSHPYPCLCVIKEFTSVWQWDSYSKLRSLDCYNVPELCLLKDVLVKNIELKENNNFEDRENAVYLKKMIHEDEFKSVRGGFENSLGYWSEFTINNQLNLCKVKKKNLDFSSTYRDDIFIKTEKFYYQYLIDTKKILPEYLEYFLESKYFKGTFYANDPFDTRHLENEDTIDTYPIDDGYKYFYITKHVYENSLILLPNITEQEIIVNKDQLMKDINSELTNLRLSLIGNIEAHNSKEFHESVLLDIKNRVINTTNHTPYIARILSDGENSKSEFKAAYHAALCGSDLTRSDYRSGMSKKDSENCIEYRALKAICGFLNTNGGKVFIGINDKPEVVGIDDEMKKFHKNSDDVYIRFIESRIRQFFGNNKDEINLEIHSTGGMKVLEITCGSVLEALLDGKELWARKTKNVYRIKPEDVNEHLKKRKIKLTKKAKHQRRH